MDSFSITTEQLHSFHSIDREVFSRLVINLVRDPAESMLVIGLWLWLEGRGYPKIIAKMKHLLDPIVEALANEAVLCLKTLESNTLPVLSSSTLPVTSIVMGTSISLTFLHENKFTAICGIKNYLTGVCSRTFTDILQHVLLGRLPSSSPQPNTNQLPLRVPGFPHPLFGDVTIMPIGSNPTEFNFPSTSGGIWEWNPTNTVSEDDRTMFLTFSRGFPVTTEEVTELFTKICDDTNAVVKVQMQENVPSNEQPLFSRMVLRSITFVDRILRGRRIAKFRINGKHIWARKYERRDN